MKVEHTVTYRGGKPVTKVVKPAAPKLPTRTELVNAKKAAAGHRKFQADYVAKAKAATGKDKADFEALAATHKSAAEKAEKTLQSAPKKKN
jgi:hypothetical protein